MCRIENEENKSRGNPRSVSIQNGIIIVVVVATGWRVDDTCRLQTAETRTNRAAERPVLHYFYDENLLVRSSLDRNAGQYHWRPNYTTSYIFSYLYSWSNTQQITMVFEVPTQSTLYEDCGPTAQPNSNKSNTTIQRRRQQDRLIVLVNKR